MPFTPRHEPIPDYSQFSVYHRHEDGSLGSFLAPCELPLTEDSVEECRQAVVDALGFYLPVRDEGSFSGYAHQNKAVLVVIPGGKA